MTDFALSDRGAAFLKVRELGPDGKVALKAYKCSAGKWTVGWGHTGKDVTEGTTCTLAQAEAWFAQDVASSVKAVNAALAAPYAFKATQPQFDMLVSLTHNIGVAAFNASTLCSGLRNGLGAFILANEFLKWKFINGKVSNGLLNRRKVERQIFLGGY